MKYYIKRISNVSQFIQISLHIHCEQNERVKLQLATWRPGRYEIANFAKNIRSFEIKINGGKIPHKKISKDCWVFESTAENEYEICYEFYCAKMDAGSCWSDDEMLYLNFSNFIFEIQGREKEDIEIEIDYPNNYKVATALPLISGNNWKADGYQHAMDSPWVAGKHVSHQSYTVGGSKFHLWWIGDIHFSSLDVLKVFQEFTKKMIEDFQDFPASDYHFINILLPYKHYHGVEHRFSTVITIGPAIDLAKKELLDELIGVSSHELYHFWNVCRIRPKEILEYDLSKEVLLDSGYILEGITTYMGDYYLLKSGYFSLSDYLKILEKQIQKESDNLGWRNETIVDSSCNLWLDGYTAGIPEDKVNIYNRGALISFCLDTSLKKDGSGLHVIMKKLWEDFGKSGKGYQLKDFINIVQHHSEESYRLINQLLYEKVDLIPILKKYLAETGIQLEEHFDKNALLHVFGIRIDENKQIKQVHPDSAAYYSFMAGDELLMKNGEKISKGECLELSPGDVFKVKRYGRKIDVFIEKEHRQFFPRMSLSVAEQKTIKNTKN